MTIELGKAYLQKDHSDMNYFIAKKWDSKRRYLLVDLFSIDKNSIIIQLNRKWEYFEDQGKEIEISAFRKLIIKTLFTKTLGGYSLRDNRRKLSNSIKL